MPADLNQPLDRWVILPGDQPELRRWLARRRPAPANDVLPPPGEPPEDP